MEFPADPKPQARQAAYRRIADELRDQILSGKLAPGEQLPSQGKLAALWHSNAFTVHTAVKTLVKEGWVDSIRGGGVYVAQSKDRFVCAGLYGATFSSENESQFLQRIHVSLLGQFRRMKKEVLVFTDTRPMWKQRPVLPALAEAIRTRRIQCLVFPGVHAVNYPALSRLGVPTATMFPPSSKRADFDKEHLLREGVRHLVREGCRSIGLISNIQAGKRTDGDHFHRLFRKAVRQERARTRADWNRSPSHHIHETDLERYGYMEFKRLWELREKPDGLIVYPDSVVQGAIMAILETGRTAVTQQMKFVFHRNAHVQFFCPLSVTWAISDEEMLAKGLIHIIEKQFAGEKVSPTFIPFTFKTDGAEF